MAACCYVNGCWAFDVGCWMFPGFRGREQLSTGWDRSPAGEHFPAWATVLPLPKGDGRGEGEGRFLLNSDGQAGVDAGDPASTQQKNKITLRHMEWARLKKTAVAGAAILLVIGITTVVTISSVRQSNQYRLRLP